MTVTEIYNLLKTSNLPVAYSHFEEGKAPPLPYVVFRLPNSNNFAADGNVYKAVTALYIELYTEKKDLATEKKLEDVLNNKIGFYNKLETLVISEKMYQIIYSTEVLIDG